MAQRKRRRSSRPKKNQEYPGWLWMLFGLSLGLSVAFAVHVKDRKPADVEAQAKQQAASLQDSLDDNGENASTTAAETAPVAKRFTFYDVLPNFEVVIPAKEPIVSADREPQAVVEPGTYVLQTQWAPPPESRPRSSATHHKT